MEVLDRIIGSNIDEISTFEAYSALIAFAEAGEAEIRPKITALLLSTLSDNFD